MSRSRIGPLALESPLGGRGSNVYRAVHVQQKMQVAVRIYSVPLGMTPESKRDFAEQMERLKRLRHPGIVRCFGGGFDQRDAYLVHELVDGESLDQLLERRQRLSWEVASDYGLQICNALQLAHEGEWAHGRIRPDKILVSRDGSTVKIADFCRDWSASNLIRTTTKLSDLAYLAPEQLEASSDLEPNVASDLYSVGAVLYHMLTGRSPFVARDASQMRLAIQQETLPPVSSIILDCPVWLNAIVEQLLEKDPQKRPFTAAAVSMALKEAQRRATLGTSVAQHAVSGFSPLQLKSADRAEAEKVLGRKPKKVKKTNDGPAFYERVWFLVICLFAIIGGVAWLMLPLSERQLRERAEKLLATNEAVDWNDARDRYLLPLIEKSPQSEDAAWAREQLAIIEMNNAERKMERNAKLNREPGSEGERRYIEAKQFERFGDRITALEKYNAIINLMKDVEAETPFVNLAKRQAQDILKNPPSAGELRKFLTAKIEEADRLSAKGDVVGSTKILESIVSLYNGNLEMKAIVESAQSKLRK